MLATSVSISAGEKPPERASSAKRSRMALRGERRGTKKTMVDAAQMTKSRKARRFAISLKFT
jgi:hypothetical protein